MSFVTNLNLTTVKRIFLIAGLFIFLLPSAAWAERKVAHNIKISKELPRGWTQPVDVVIALTDGNSQEVRRLSAHIQVSKAVTINVGSLKPGPYTITIKRANSTDTPAAITAQVIKKKGDDNIVLEFSDCLSAIPYGRNVKKPVIYLYPPTTEDIAVHVQFAGELTQTIPAYAGGWKVTATPDGTITNHADGKQYPYLFWEGMPASRTGT